MSATNGSVRVQTRPKSALSLSVLTALLLSVSALQAQENETELAKKTQNPVADLISMSFQSNFNFGAGNLHDTMVYLLNIQPVIPFHLTENWNLITRTIIPIIDQPSLFPGFGNATGLGDINPSFFLSPAGAGKLIWGFGPTFTLSTATDDRLGGSKWSAGPAAVALSIQGPWVFGALINTHVNASGKEFNTVHANNFRFYEELNEIVQEEPNEAQDPELLGLLASLGIEKGKPFAPDERMKKILTEAAVGNATARATLFATRDKEFYLYPNSQWKSLFPCGSHEFLGNGVRRLDARMAFFYYATGITPAMAAKKVGAGSQYAYIDRDSQGNYLDGGKTYKLTIPPNPLVKQFWSLVLYDSQTRSQLQTDAQFPSIGSQKEGIQKNADGSVDVYFGPKAPAGKESNWVQTVPGKGWNTILRLYGPLEPWFDKTWKPGEIVEVK